MLEIYTHGNQNYDEIIKFLNINAKDFYEHKIEFADPNFMINFKCMLLSSIISIARVIKGTFNSSLDFEEVDLKKFKLMFPNISSRYLFDIRSNSDLKECGSCLRKLRNINAHAFISKNDMDIFESFDNIEYRPELYNCINYSTGNKELTIGGLIYIVANFLRFEALRELCRKHIVFKTAIQGRGKVEKVETFIKHVSFVNWEVSIRRIEGYDLYNSIVGEYGKEIKDIGGIKELRIGNGMYSAFYIKFSIEKNQITIYKGSRTKTYYFEDYVLNIEDLDSFIYYSSILPPFTFIDFLKESGVNTFDSKSNNSIEDKQEMLMRLNHAKFYSNKNISTLLMPDEIADYRLTSQIVCDSLTKIFINLEDKIIRKLGNINSLDYSTINDALNLINMNDSLKRNVYMLRTCATHGYLLDDWVFTELGMVHFTLELVINTLKGFLNYLKNYDDEMFFVFNDLVCADFINTIINMQYKPITVFSRKILSNENQLDVNELQKKYKFIERTYIKFENLFPLINEFSNFNKLIMITSDIIKKPLFIYKEKLDLDILNAYEESNNYLEEQIQNINPFILKLTLKNHNI